MPGLDGVDLCLVETLEDALEFKRWLGERHEGGVIAVDTETTGLDPREAGAGIRLIQFGDTQRGWAVPWQDWRGLSLEALNAWEGEIVTFNQAFEWKWLNIHGDWRMPRDRSVDAMLAANIIDPLGPGGLKPLSVKYVDKRAALGQDALKNGMTENGWTWATIPVDFEPYWTYAALDAIITARLWLTLKPRIAASYQDVFDLEMAARFIISEMEHRGARVDIEYSRQKHDELSGYSESVLAWGRTRYKANLGSNVQLAKVMESLGGKIVEHTPTGQPRVTKETLEFFASEGSGSSAELRELCETVLKMRKSRKWASTYFQNFIDRQHGGFLHPEIRTIGARTGRMSVSSPALQQLPSRGSALVRDAFVPRDGHLLVSCDYAQMELRILSELADDPGLAAAFRVADTTGGDFFVEVGKQVYGPGFLRSDPRRSLIKNVCVPMGAKILTDRGVLAHDEVEVGDLTVGYNWSTGRSEWTRVTEVVRPAEPQDVVVVSDGRSTVAATPEHRWVVTRSYADRPMWRTTSELSPADKVLLASPLAYGYTAGIDWLDAALLGWIVSAGTVVLDPEGGAPDVRVRQSAPDGVRRVRQLRDSLIDVLSEFTGSAAQGPSHVWTVRPDYARALLAEVGLLVPAGERPDPVEFAAQFDEGQRAALLRSMSAADGGASTEDQELFDSSDAWTAGVYRALKHLQGEVTYSEEHDGSYRVHTLDEPSMDLRHAAKVVLPAQRVWCVKTELGTWTTTLGEGSPYMLTGNCYGLIYGAGTETMAETAKVEMEFMQTVVDSLHARFPGIKRFMDSTEQLGTQRLRSEGVAYVVTPSGRRLPADDDRVYALTNYCIQSTGADVLKRALTRLDAAGLIDYAILPIHDEVLFDVPEDLVEDVLRTVPELMSEMDHAVPLTAEAEGGFARWGYKYQ